VPVINLAPDGLFCSFSTFFDMVTSILGKGKGAEDVKNKPEQEVAKTMKKSCFVATGESFPKARDFF
jgi:hypothetical protein